ncbi:MULTISPECIES: FAD-dependent oxidoreductase [unclassified Marinitoga]|uniref:FAD-dependent oxidoreductase n=1 Tax=unclassified Marinitoga TaxID=2640159 RepID=UPI000640EAD4|nr:MULTISPECIES: FAD-dependent oxidoreductase [unclassified Marinitoga]KLO23938.1 protein fixC [Marinitoga sp. 1155]NUU99168.1 electron transfer flavoprotein [Marinitoga sp. 1154]
MIEYDVIIVGAGPAGLSAAYKLATAGINVAVIEKGEYPGSKNVMGGVLYLDPLKKLISKNIINELIKKKVVERNIIEQNMWILNDDGVVKIGHRNEKWKDNPNAYTVLRAKFDSWFAGKVSEVGGLIIPKTKVEDFIYEDGKLIGVKTSRPEGNLKCKAVIIAEGVNPILTIKAGLRKEDIKPKMVAIAVKEIIPMPNEKINDIFGVRFGEGATIEIIGSWSNGMMGIAFLYSNKESISLGAGVLLEDLMKNNSIRPYELLQKLKDNPIITDLLGEYKNSANEYMAHLIPEGGYYAMPKIYGNNILVVGDAGMMVNSIHREGSNHAITSGMLAANTLIEAFEKNDFSAKTLKKYYLKLKKTFIIKDLKKYKDLTTIMEKNHQFFEVYPALVNDAAYKFLNIDGTPKWDMQKDIFEMIRKKRGLIGIALDALKFWRGVR